MKVDIGDKIGEGRYRECFEVEGTDLCVKKPKKKLQKRYFGFILFFRMKLYTLFKFRTKNFNKKEYEIFKSLPAELNEYLPRTIVLEDGLIFLERPRDFDGTYSKTVEELGSVDNARFWGYVDQIADILTKNRMFLLDTFNLGNNVIVQKISPEEWKPVLIDVKRLGYYTYPFQLHLILKSQQRKKFLRRLLRFRNLFEAVE